jgi:hypothetical protein
MFSSANHDERKFRCRGSRPHAAILAEKDFEPWLNGQAGIELLQPAPVEIVWMVLFLGTGTGIIEWTRRKS